MLPRIYCKLMILFLTRDFRKMSWEIFLLECQFQGHEKPRLRLTQKFSREVNTTNFQTVTSYKLFFPRFLSIRFHNYFCLQVLFCPRVDHLPATQFITYLISTQAHSSVANNSREYKMQVVYLSSVHVNIACHLRMKEKSV